MKLSDEKQRELLDMDNDGCCYVPNKVFYLKGLSPNALSVYVHLFDLADDEDLKCLESVDHISYMLNISKRSVQNSIKELIKFKIISREKRFGQPSITTILSIDHLPEVDLKGANNESI